MARSLLLDRSTWDLCVDAAGNIAVADAPYALAQDAACAIRTFAGELYYDTTDGVPYWGHILGRFPPLALLKQRFEEAALTVPGVVRAACYITDVTDRVLHGQVQVWDQAGNVSAAGF